MPDTTAQTATAIRCRAIEDADLDAVAELLARGFPNRTLDYWHKGLEILRDRPAIGDLPRYGFLIEDGPRIGGVLLTLYVPGQSAGAQRCNLSSWYVDPDYRLLAMRLDRAATRDKTTTYLNISPAEHTRKLIAALGYVSLNEDTVLAAPWLSALRFGVKVEVYVAAHDALLDDHEAQIARDHQAWGCTVLVATENGRARPFVFQRMPLRGLCKGAVQIIYTPSQDDLVRMAGPLGRALLARGIFIWKLDGASVPRGLIGRKFNGRSPRWSKGPNPPHLNNLSFTELAIFGP